MNNGVMSEKLEQKLHFKYINLILSHFLQERRWLKFWYVDGTDYLEQVTTAYEFFKELVRPQNLPRGNLYVDF